MFVIININLDKRGFKNIKTADRLEEVIDGISDEVKQRHIKRLREKLEGVESNWQLKTVWGVGYKFEVRSDV